MGRSKNPESLETGCLDEASWAWASWAWLQTIAMQAPLRQLSRHALPLSNPLDEPITFVSSVNNAEVSVPREFTLQPNSKADFEIEWRPLLPRESTSQLTLSSDALGSFVYDLKLHTLPAGEPKTLGFKVALGDAQAQRFRFTNFLRRAETYKLALGGSGDFECDGSVAAAAAETSAGAEVVVDVTFEPSKMGEARDTLTVSSAEGGEFVCTLTGTALPPKPQGPIGVKAGGSAQVSFKNVFTSAADFAFTCEPAAFSVAKPKESVPPKKTTQVGVSYKPPADAPPGDVSGKLTVSGPDGFTQLYYLSGTS